MNVTELKEILVEKADKNVGFALPDGDPNPAQCHVTEVGLVTKKAVDCGGTFRETAMCRLQIWEGEDREHRLSAGKLARILEIARTIVKPESLSVEVEYEACSLSQYPIERAMILPDRVVFHLASKHTDCLARERCGLPSRGNESSSSTPNESDLAPSSCCGGKSC